MKRILFDVAALIARVATGVIFVAHGWQKWQSGIGATGRDFREMGIPMPEFAAGFATVVEVLGGIFLIVGLLVRPVALLLLVNMLGAIAFVHLGKGIMTTEGGWELPGLLAALSLLFLTLGGGRLGLDTLIATIFRRRSGRHRVEEEDIFAGRSDRAASTGPTTGPTTAGPTTAGPTTAGPTTTGPTTAGRTGGPLTPADSGKPAEPPHVPRQPTAPRTGASNLSDADMRDIDALVADDQPEHRKPPNR